MKTKLLFLFSIFALCLDAQQTALTNNTWYLTKLTINNVDYAAPSNSEVTSITANFDTSNHLMTKICNMLTSSVVHNSSANSFTISSGALTLIVCQNSSNLTYEDKYFVQFFNHGFGYYNPYNYVITPLSNGNQLVITNGQGNKAYYNSFYLSTTDQSKKKSRIQIFENPVKNKLKLTNIESSTLLKVYDTQGNLVLQKEYSVHQKDNAIEIDVNNIEKGIYFVIVFANSEVLFTEKFIKE